MTEWRKKSPTIVHAQLAQWHGLDFEEKRGYHEQAARSFEVYLFEGKAPSLELQPYFQKFRAWLLNVYRQLLGQFKGDLKQGLDSKLDDTVRAVFDRMLATNEQIALAERSRGMMPAFTAIARAGCWCLPRMVKYCARWMYR